MLSKNRYQEPTITYGQMHLLFHIRNLWREMATWTRAYMTSSSANLAIRDDVFNRLYKVSQEFANIIGLVFGDQIAEQFLQYLSVQLVLTKELIDAQIDGNVALVNELFRQLFQNADEIAKFMASINPFWNETVIRNLIYTYHQYTLQEIATLLSQENQKNIDSYDILLHHADSMGDYFAQGLFNYLSHNPQSDQQSPLPIS